MEEHSSRYYHPYYPSDSDNDSTDDGSIWSEPPDELPRPDNVDSNLPNFAALARGLQVPTSLATGPSLPSDHLDNTDLYGKFTTDSNADISGTLTTAKSNIDSVIMLNSQDRDKSVYVYPTSCQLFLPRDYKNVVLFNIVQINLTCTFYYFSAQKKNVNITLYENGRVNYPSILQPSMSPTSAYSNLNIINTIRDGTYNINDLLTELQLQLNRTPLFYDYINGFSDFYKVFIVNGDYSLNFNYPGDSYYDSLRQVFILNPTRAQIVSYYFNSQYANLFNYTLKQVSIAYYYPVLKEILLDTDFSIETLNLTYESMTIADVRSYILYRFTGLNDPIILQIITNNTDLLDVYRLQHTFRYGLINEYTCTYNIANNKVLIQSVSLNTSLLNLLNTQYNSYLTQQLALNSITTTDYNTTIVNNNNILSILQSMYDFIQRNLATYFAVNYGTYVNSYFINIQNTLLLQSGLNAASVRYSYNNYSTPAISNDIFTKFRNNPVKYWPNISSIGSTVGPVINMGSNINPYPISSNFVYNLAASNLDTAYNFIDSNGSIYTDSRRQTGDVLANIQASKYTIFKFRSGYRQTLQVETIPRETIYRYPEYNKSNSNYPYPVYNNGSPGLCDISYTFAGPSTLSSLSLYSKIVPDITYNVIQGWSTILTTQSNFGISYSNSLGYWSNSYDTLKPANFNGNYYRLQTPLASNDGNIYKYTIDVHIQSASSSSGTFEGDMYAYIYHDISAFSADIGRPYQESNVFYKHQMIMKAGTPSTLYTFSSYENQEYYIVVRHAQSNTPIQTNYQIIPSFPNGTAVTRLTRDTNFDPSLNPQAILNNYTVAIAADPDYIRLPINSTIYGYQSTFYSTYSTIGQEILYANKSTLYGDKASPFDASINIENYTTASNIGYDISGISSDLTDYILFYTDPPAAGSKNPRIAVDPITNYVFFYRQPYNIVKESYDIGFNNQIYTSNANILYTIKGVLERSYKLCQYYNTTYISSTYDTSGTSISQILQPYSDTTLTNGKIYGYTYTGATSNILTLGSGVCGFMFAPTTGFWHINRITFKTNFTSTVNPNSNILCLGVFITSEVSQVQASSIRLENALAICLPSGTSIYSSTRLNDGFDPTYGTYHTFSNNPSLVTRNDIIDGFIQRSRSLITDVNSYYSVLAFGGSFSPNDRTTYGNATVIPIIHLTGSPNAYPYNYTASASTKFYDSNTTPTGQGVVVSSYTVKPGSQSIYGPQGVNDPSICSYEQSMPFVNSHIHYLEQSDIIYYTNAFRPWTLSSAKPTALFTSIPTYMLIQTTSFILLEYNTTNYVFNFKATLSASMIFPSNERTSMLAITGNSTLYIFLGVVDGTNQLVFKTYNPVTGILTRLQTNSTYTFDTRLEVRGFIFNDSNSWFLTSVNRSTSTVVLQGDPVYNLGSSTYINLTGLPGNSSYLQCTPTSKFFYFTYTSTNIRVLYKFSVNPSDSNYIRSQSTMSFATQILLNNAYSPAIGYTRFSVNINNQGSEDIILLTDDPIYSKYFMKIISTANLIIKSSQKFITPPSIIYGGANSSWWILNSTAPYIYGYIQGNSLNSIETAWQIFFPTIKIEFTELSAGIKPILNLTKLTYPEWPHTAMFAYSNYASLMADISGQWGLESSSNFMVSDVNFNGFYFNSFIENIPLLSNSTNDYYIAIRGFLPTESFQTLVRFTLPKQYTFGYVRLIDMIDEIQLLRTNPDSFYPVYYNALSNFASNFVLSNQNFGVNITQGYSGSNITSSNFGDFLNQYSTIYSVYEKNVSTLAQIQTGITNSLQQFIQHDLQYIVPSNFLVRQQYTDPIAFNILWKSTLSPKFQTLSDEWGLGWNLGYPKEDLINSTTYLASNIFKIQQGYIYLQLNPEFNINRVDAGSKEDYSISKEPSGITNNYYCKLLLTDFGGVATTFFHNPVTFNPPLGKLSRLNFQWLDATGNQLSNVDADWNMVINISEQLNTQTKFDR